MTRSGGCPRASVLVALACVAGAFLGGCSERDEAAEHITPEEAVLLDRLTRDAYTEIIDRTRTDDGYLLVTTQQGDVQARYLLAPDSPASKQLRIRRMDEAFSFPSAISPRPGINPDPRGLEQP